MDTDPATHWPLTKLLSIWPVTPIDHLRARYIDVTYEYIRHKVAETKSIRIHYTPTEHMVAGTKRPLDSSTSMISRARIGLITESWIASSSPCCIWIFEGKL